MAESNIKLADWTRSSLTGCRGIISCHVLLSEGVVIGNGLLDVSAALGSLRMPPDIGNRKRLLTKQLSRPGLGVLLLVPNFLLFSGGRALHYSKRKSEEAVDSQGALAFPDGALL